MTPTQSPPRPAVHQEPIEDTPALRHQLAAEREAALLPAELQTTARVVQTIAIIGAGTMGTGIAICALDAGLKVILLEQDEAALERGRLRVIEHYQKRVAAGKLKADVAAANEARLHPTTDWKLDWRRPSFEH